MCSSVYVFMGVRFCACVFTYVCVFWRCVCKVTCVFSDSINIMNEIVAAHSFSSFNRLGHFSFSK